MVKVSLQASAAVLSLPVPLDPDVGCNEMQAAIFLGISVRTLQAWRVRGVGPSYTKIGRCVRYQRRALIDFQRAHTVTSTPDADTHEDSAQESVACHS